MFWSFNVDLRNKLLFSHFRSPISIWIYLTNGLVFSIWLCRKIELDFCNGNRNTNHTDTIAVVCKCKAIVKSILSVSNYCPIENVCIWTTTLRKHKITNTNENKEWKKRNVVLFCCCIECCPYQLARQTNRIVVFIGCFTIFNSVHFKCEHKQ